MSAMSFRARKGRKDVALNVTPLIDVLFLLIMLKHTPTRLPGGKIHLLILRGLLGFSAMILFFYTITTIPLGVAITLNKTSPLFVSILAFFLRFYRRSSDHQTRRPDTRL